jgi:rhodanese-related sulfurtransferase
VGIIIRDAALVVLLSAVVGFGGNALRSDGLPLVATEDYEIFVPCPEPRGEVDRVEPGDPRVRAERTLLLDARSADAFAAWHVDGARHLPFDYLDAVGDADVRSVAGSGAAQVIVYGDGGDPDSGEELARELAGRGVRNVAYVAGGAPALHTGGAEDEREREEVVP